MVLLIKDFALKHKQSIAIGLAFILLVFVLYKGINKVATLISDRRVAALEQTIKDAEAKQFVLQGQIDALNGQLTIVRGELAESNKQLQAAESIAEQSRVVYVTAKTKGPTFVSKTNEGKIQELIDVMNRLYP